MAVEENAPRDGVSRHGEQVGANAERSALESELDRAVANMFDERSDEQRLGFEAAFITDNDEVNSSLSDAPQSMDELTGVLPPEIPPSFAKERIMARVREDSVTYFVPPPVQD